ncbi:hypothetical protein HOLleu_10235 [Holothuria leucospilota]|uniref:HTH CENPB-type domain-containing protein n=1 Tax=Holothuria leucospilota TaxID=206669 RepID=A0A9Q1CDV3_HOLLE|nr:hypothetical protein HOLleu_10235 [Holothuria leucospilota]
MVCSSGPKTVLTKSEEDTLSNWLVEMSKIGYGRTVPELKLIGKEILDKDGWENPFKDNMSGRGWVE